VVLGTVKKYGEPLGALVNILMEKVLGEAQGNKTKAGVRKKGEKKLILSIAHYQNRTDDLIITSDTLYH
jgi:hypothetical protein